MSSIKISKILTEIRKGIPYVLLYMSMSVILAWLGVESLIMRYLIILVIYLVVTTLFKYIKK